MSNIEKNFKGANNPNYKNGYCVKGKTPGFYNSWQNMKQRCLNKNHPKYDRYGGRGISITDAWLTIEGFSSWALSSGWESGLTLDRKDNNGNYCPKNCHWVTLSKNSRKKSTTKITRKDAEEIRKRVSEGECEHKIAKEYDVVHGTIWFITNNITHVDDGECSKKLKRKKTPNANT